MKILLVGPLDQCNKRIKADHLNPKECVIVTGSQDMHKIEGLKFDNLIEVNGVGLTLDETNRIFDRLNF